MKIQAFIILFFLSISWVNAQCSGFTEHLTIDPKDGAIPQCTPVNCTWSLCNYTTNSRNILAYIYFDSNYEFFNSGDFVVDNDPNLPNQIRLRLLTTNLQSACTDFHFQIRSLGGTCHIGGEIQFPSTSCPTVVIPTRFMIPESISIVGVDGQTTNISSAFPSVPYRILVRGNVVLDQGTSGNIYNIDGSTPSEFIVLDRNASITVPNGMNLVVNNAFIRGCVNKWESIVVENGAGLDIRRTKIEDGRKAIVARDRAFITSFANDFTDNVISYYTDYSSQVQNVNTFIGGCNFTGTGQLKPDNGIIPDNEIPTSGIEIHNTIGLFVGFLVGNNGAFKLSRFENLSDGIDALHSIVSVNFGQFKNMMPTTNYSGIGILSSGFGSSLYYNGWTNSVTNFENCEVGIASVNALDMIIERASTLNVNYSGISVAFASPNSSIQLLNNQIIGSKLGIRSLWNSMGFGQISDNYILSYANDGDASNSYALKANEAFFSGNWQIRKNRLLGEYGRGAISFNRGNNTTIAENKIVGSDFFDAKATAFGGTTNSTIRCNDISSSQNGLTAGLYLSTGGGNVISCNNIENVSRGFDFLGMNDNTDLKGNSLNSTNFGLQIQESSYIGVQDHRGNLFNGPFFNPNGDGATHLSNDLNIIALSEFNVNSNLNPSFCPFPNGCGGNWFIEDPNNSNPFQCNTNDPFGTCPLGIGVGFQSPNEGGLNARLMSGNARDFSNPNILWTGQKQLYESLVNNRDLLANSRGFSSFVREQSQKPIGKYFAIQNNVRELVKRTQEMTNTVGVKAEENRRTVKEVNTVFEKYVETKDKTEKKQLEKQIKLLNQKIAVNHTYNLAKLAAAESAKNRDIDQLIAENERLEARIQVEKNTKAVNRIMLEAYKGREAKLSEEQIRILEPIANQCPIDGGEAVYEARSLLGFVENLYYDDARLCPEINSANSGSNAENQALKTAVPTSKSLTFNVSPNPAKDVLDVVFSTKIGENTEGSLKIINAYGAIVLSQKVVNNSQNHLDISTLTSGIYLIRLEVGGTSQVQKITILK
jgi:hypothetical protein